MQISREALEKKRANIAAGDAALASAKGKLKALEFVGARAARQVAMQFYTKAGDEVWASKMMTVQALDEEIQHHEQHQQEQAEFKVNAQSGDAALKVAWEKLAAKDVAGANAASAAAASFYHLAGMYDVEKSKELAELDQQLLKLAAQKQAEQEELAKRRLLEDEERNRLVVKAEEEAAMWKQRAADERAKGELARSRIDDLPSDPLGASSEMARAGIADGGSKSEVMEAAQETVTEEVRQAHRALALLEHAKQEARGALEAMHRAYDLEEEARRQQEQADAAAMRAEEDLRKQRAVQLKEDEERRDREREIREQNRAVEEDKERLQMMRQEAESARLREIAREKERRASLARENLSWPENEEDARVLNEQKQVCAFDGISLWSPVFAFPRIVVDLLVWVGGQLPGQIVAVGLLFLAHYVCLN